MSPVAPDSAVVDEGVYVDAGNALPAVQERQLDHEQRSDDHAAEPLDELDLRPGRSTRREDVVEDDHPGARLERVDMHLEGISAVLERVARLDRFPWQLAGL